MGHGCWKNFNWINDSNRINGSFSFIRTFKNTLSFRGSIVKEQLFLAIATERLYLAIVTERTFLSSSFLPLRRGNGALPKYNKQ